MKKILLIAFVMFFLAMPAYAATAPIEVNVISALQVIPGSIMKVRVSILNIQNISSQDIQSADIKDQVINLKNNINEEKEKIIIDAIRYENPFQLSEDKIISEQVSISNLKSKELKNNKYSILKPRQEKKAVDKKLASAGNAVKLRDDLKKEFNAKIKTEKLSEDQIRSYADLENELKKIIENGRNSVVLELLVPEEFPEGTVLTIPINIDYSTELLSDQTFSTFATATVTSNPVPKRAIIIDIDGAKRDALYNSLPNMPNMSAIVNNGVKFTDAKTVFPSITLAAQASIFTGNYPGKHKIAGNEWFEKNSLTYRKYSQDVWYEDIIWNEGQANEDLNPNVNTIYEAAKDGQNMDSTVIFNHYSRLDGSTSKWIKPGVEEYLYTKVWPYFDWKVDNNAMSNALEELTYYNPKLLTIYLPGLDGYSHRYGPNGVDPYNQEYYFKNYVDEQIGRLLNGDCVDYSILGDCNVRFEGLIDSGLNDETIIVIVSDHGQTSVVNDDAHAISKAELEEVLKNSGYDINDNLFEFDYDAVAAPNGGMAQIYIRNQFTNNWNDVVSLDDLSSALDAFKFQTAYVDAVLVRYAGYANYRVYIGGGETQDLQTYFTGKANYVDAVNRIKGLNSARSGDIILLAKDEYYFADEIMKGEHGGLSPDESYIPLIFSGPTIRKGETDSMSASNIDMAKTLGDLLGFSMPNADGSILPVQDNFGYRMKDSNASDGPVYGWIDITSTGIKILPDSDDVYSSGLPVGFFFNFYGTDYSHVSITNNGIVLASGGTSQYINQPIGGSIPHNFISPFWDDLVTWGSAGAIYYRTIGTAPNRMFVVEWYDNQHYTTSTSGVTFEAILYEGTNNIKFQYKDVDFGTVSNSTSSDLPPYNNGGSATVGIEGQDGRGLQYSYNQQALNPGLAILFKFPAFSGTNMYLSKNAPLNMDHGNTMTYTLHYNNFGSTIAYNVALEDILPVNLEFISASDGGTYNSDTRKVIWNIGSVAVFPLGRGTRTVTVKIPASVLIGTVIQNTASISTSTFETRYDDNSASALTKITESNLPPDVSVVPIIGISGGTPSVDWNNPTTYTYQSCSTATSVDIRIHINDGGVDIEGSMAGGPSDWIYALASFYPRYGVAEITYSVSDCTTSSVSFNIYIDPAGYIYDAGTGLRISGASVWLQRPDGSGDWENVPILQTPAIMQPDANPLITGADGQYQWDVLEGIYRVHVEAPGYYPADSIVVNIPPVVTDLHIGLNRMSISDLIPPTTTIALSGILGNNDWYISDVGLSLTAVDNEGGTGVNRIEYSFDNAIWTAYSASFTITAEGTATIYYRSVDNAGNTESARSQLINIDKTPPQITINLPVSGNSYILNQTVIANWSVNDLISGVASAIATISNGTAIDTFTIGTKNFSVNAKDNAGNQAMKTLEYNVVYNYSGVLPPVKDSKDSFKFGSTIPVKFQLWDTNGNNISTAIARIYLANVISGIVGSEIKGTSPGKSNVYNLFKYDVVSNRYIFNLATKPLTKGTWKIRIELDDGTSKHANIRLK